jgi:protocatechuate 3,4-dioxygenase beta subunit
MEEITTRSTGDLVMTEILIKLLIIMGVFIVPNAGLTIDYKCSPTPEDSLGPYYKPNATFRSSVGEGYVLSGTVVSAKDCSIVEEAKIEFWLAGPDGNYDDEHRGLVLSQPSGDYKFTSNPPPKYNFRPPHIHIRVSAEGYSTLVTQHYPVKGTSEGVYPLVLRPR